MAAPWTHPPIELLHGTDDDSATHILTSGVDLTKCSPLTDFGCGFYTTTHLDQARVWATLRAMKLRPLRSSVRGVVLAMSVDRSWLGSLDSLVFPRPAPETGFEDFVRYSRAGKAPHRPTGNYDVVYGPVAQWQGLWSGTRVFTIADCDQVSFHAQALVGVGGPLLHSIRELWREP